MPKLTKNAAEVMIDHHLKDVYEGIDMGSVEIAEFSLNDLLELLHKLPLSYRYKLADKYQHRILRAQKDLNNFKASFK